MHLWLMSCRQVQGRLPHPALRTMHGTIFASAEMASAVGVRLLLQSLRRRSRLSRVVVTMRVLYSRLCGSVCVET